MPFQRVPNTVQVDAVFRLFSQRVENVFHIEWPDGVDAAAIADSAILVRDWVQDSYLIHLSNQLEFLFCEAKNLNIEDGGTSIAPALGTRVGGVSGVSAPGNVTLCIALRTAESGRNHRGRKYVPGIPETSRSGNQVTSSYAGNLVSDFTELITAIEAANAFLVVVSRFLNNVLRLEAIVTRVVAATAVNLDLDSQRRRLTGRGS